jgi:two-component system cell cycle response regulator
MKHAVNPMDLRFCTKYGFDGHGIKSRLALLDLQPTDHPTSQQLQKDVIVPNVNKIVTAFYDFLLGQPETKQILDNERLIGHLKETQKDYLLSLGVKFDKAAYFDNRLRVGLAHSKVGIPLSLYLCAYRQLTQIIFDHFPPQLRNQVQRCHEMQAFLLKITTLDMSLAIETYHLARMNDLETSLERLKKEENLLRHLAKTDDLTGLAKRSHVVAILERALEDRLLVDSSLCLVMADLDRFKDINDTYGHLIGDGVLREVAARLRAAVREVDIVGRYGGEEFIIFFSDTSLETAYEIAERIRGRIGATSINLQGIEIKTTISLGLCSAQKDDDVNLFIERADSALYEAKRKGRNRVVVCKDDAIAGN